MPANFAFVKSYNRTANLLDDRGFDDRGGDGFGRAGLPAPLLGVGAKVIPVALVAFGRVGRRHGTVAGCAAEQSLQEGPEAVSNLPAARPPVPVEEISIRLWLLDPPQRMGRAARSAISA